MTASTLGHATTAVRGAGRVLKERQDVGRAQETVEALQQQLADLDEAFKADAEKLGSSGDLLAILAVFSSSDASLSSRKQNP